MTARFTQDCLENLFSSIRVKHPVPTSLQFKQNLKLIAISQYLKSPHTSCYENDDGQIIGGFFNKPKMVQNIEECTQTSVDTLHVLDSNNTIPLNNIELNILFNIAGYIISSIVKCTNTCSECFNSVGSKTYNLTQKYCEFVKLRCFRAETLFFVNDETFKYFHDMKLIIRRYLPHVKTTKTTKCNFIQFFMNKMQDLSCTSIKNCHDLLTKIKKRFVMFRMRISCERKCLKKHNSKTMAMHSIVK